MTITAVNYSFKHHGYVGFSNLVVKFQLFKNVFKVMFIIPKPTTFFITDQNLYFIKFTSLYIKNLSEL